MSQGQTTGPEDRLRGARTLASADEVALERLRQRLASAVRRVCPSWLALHADDIVQTVLVRLAARADGEGFERFSSMYLERAAYGATVDEIRRACRRREVALSEDGELPGQLRSEAADPEREAVAAEIGQGIQECLLALARPRRLAVTLYLQGCTVPEAARCLGWTAKRTENLVYRGLAGLRSCLQRKGLGP